MVYAGFLEATIQPGMGTDMAEPSIGTPMQVPRR